MDCFQIDNTKNLSRFFNALPSGHSVDIYSNGKLVASDLKYKEFTAFSYGNDISQKIDVYVSGTLTDPLIRSSITLPLEEIFTMALTGNKEDEMILVIEDDINQEPSKDSAIVRTINLSPDLPSVDVNFNEMPAADGIVYRDETLYAFVPPGKYLITVEDSETEARIAESRFEFKVDRIYTMYILGDEPNVEILQAVDGNTYVCL